MKPWKPAQPGPAPDHCIFYSSHNTAKQRHVHSSMYTCMGAELKHLTSLKLQYAEMISLTELSIC